MKKENEPLDFPIDWEKNMLDTLLEKLSGGVVIYKVGENIQTLRFSSSILKLSGHDSDEYTQLIREDIISAITYEEDQPELRRRIVIAAGTGAPFSMTYRIKHKDGHLVWIQLSATMMQELPDGKIYYAIITRPSEEAEIYRNIALYSDTALFIAERSTRKLIFVNSAWKKLRNFPADMDLVGRSLNDLLSPEDVLFSDEELSALPSDHFSEIYKQSSTGKYLRIQGRTINWSGYDAYLCYVSDETELHLNHNLLKQSMEVAKILTWRYDYRTKTVTDSGSMGVLFGLPKVIENVPESVIEKGFIHKNSIEVFRNMFEEMKEEKQVSCDICSSTPHNGKNVWERQIYTPLFDSKGNYIESIGTAIDVSEQKEREQNYKEQIRLKRLLANQSLAIAHFNLTQNKINEFQGTSEDILQILQADSADSALLALANNTANEDELRQFDSIKNCRILIAEYRKGQTHFIARHHFKEDERWFESSFDLISNPSNSDIEAIMIVRDISKMVTAENIVSTLMKMDYESITTIDAKTGEAHPFTRGHLDDVILEQKKQRNNIAGVEAYLRKYCDDADIDRVILETSLPYVKKILKKQQIHTVLYSLRQNESIVHKRVIYTYLGESRRTLLCAMQDLTETYRQEELQKKRLEQALKEAESANHAKTDFFSRMSHDMRTPMNGILGLAQLSENEGDIDTLKYNIMKIEESGRYLLSLINDTLDFQKIESGKMKLDPQITNLRSLVDSIIDMIRITTAEKNIDFQVAYHEIGLDYYILTDPIRLKQIFINLLSNAVKFTPEFGLIKLEVQLLKSENSISHTLIRIVDHGIGMSEEFLRDKLFMPFSQESNDVYGKYAGSGLGLSIVHRLVNMMDGKIQVTSELGKGSTFEVYLDFKNVSKEEASNLNQQMSTGNYVNSCSLKNKKILLVEDHELNAEIIIRLLEKKECTVVWAENGEIATQLFQASVPNDFDAILMDIRMPVMNGLDATKKIRSMNRDDAKKIPIIAMTANAYEEDIRQTLEAGMNCHLAKPVDVTQLYETLHHYLN